MVDAPGAIISINSVRAGLKMWWQEFLLAVDADILPSGKKRLRGQTPGFNHYFPGDDAFLSGWKPRLYVSKDGRRYRFHL